MSKTLDSIINERLNKLIHIQDPKELLSQLDSLKYFVEKKVSLTSKLSKKVSLQVGSTS